MTGETHPKRDPPNHVVALALTGYRHQHLFHRPPLVLLTHADDSHASNR